MRIVQQTYLWEREPSSGVQPVQSGLTTRGAHRGRSRTPRAILSRRASSIIAMSTTAESSGGAHETAYSSRQRPPRAPQVIQLHPWDLGSPGRPKRQAQASAPHFGFPRPVSRSGPTWFSLDSDPECTMNTERSMISYARPPLRSES